MNIKMWTMYSGLNPILKQSIYSGGGGEGGGKGG